MSAVNPENKKFKFVSHEIKEMDDSEGIVVAYANIYNNEDYDGDISVPGSFDKTVNEGFKKLRVFKNHNPNDQLGIPYEKPKADDPIGLLTYTKFNLEKDIAKDMFSDIQLNLKYGRDFDLSIGYNVVKRDESNRKRITEYALWEYSFLSNWGANPMATVQSAKSLEELSARLGNVNGVMKFLTDAYNLKYSDQRLKNIENILKSLDKEEPIESLLIEEPTDEQIKQLILKSFKI